MNLLETLVLQVLQTISFIPAVREDVEANLPADAVRQTDIRELIFKRINHAPAHVMYLIVFLELVPLSLRAGPPDRGDIQHSRAEFDKRAPL